MWHQPQKHGHGHLLSKMSHCLYRHRPTRTGKHTQTDKHILDSNHSLIPIHSFLSLFLYYYYYYYFNDTHNCEKNDMIIILIHGILLQFIMEL